LEALEQHQNSKVVLTELLKEFEGQEPEEPMVLYLARPMHFAILHFWPESGVTWEQPEDGYPDEPPARWEWLWSGVGYDLPKLASFVGAPEYIVRARVSIFAAWRWILPDGRVAPKIAAAMAEWTRRKPEAEKPVRQKPN
jgi:hypothetical protein